MKLLVSVAACSLCSHLCGALVRRGDTVSVIDNFNDFYDPAIKRSNVSNFPRSVRVYEIDLCDQVATTNTLAEQKPDAIIHLAARAGVRPSVHSPELYLQTNIFGTFNLLEADRKNGVSTSIFAY